MNERPIDIQEIDSAATETVEYVDLWIPIYRFAGNNRWFSLNSEPSRDDAIKSLGSLIAAAEIKILHHVERWKAL